MASTLKRPYIIFRRPPGSGYWSNFLCVVQGIDHADRHDLVPVVDMERFCTRYSEDDDHVLGTRNAWEYYFDQPGGLILSEALRMDPLDSQGCEEGCFTSVQTLQPPAEILDRVRELLGRYIRVKPQIMAEVESILGRELRQDVLGVDVRGSGLGWRNISGHPVPPPAIVYLEQALALDRKLVFSRIFLACDELDTVGLFREHFGDRLLTAEAPRSPASATFSGDHALLAKPRRELHRYRLGREALVDVLLLARCGHLMCGISEVAHAAMYFSPGRQSVHPVPPLWYHPLPHEASRGRSFLNACPKLEGPLSTAALAMQVQELQRLLESAENSRVEAMTKADRQGEPSPPRREDSAPLREELRLLRKKLDKANSQISRLKRRVSQLVNKWTWLGWRLMPWTKPSWRGNPLDD